jgi:hypothetical protein
MSTAAGNLYVPKHRLAVLGFIWWPYMGIHHKSSHWQTLAPHTCVTDTTHSRGQAGMLLPFLALYRTCSNTSWLVVSGSVAQLTWHL